VCLRYLRAGVGAPIDAPRGRCGGRAELLTPRAKSARRVAILAYGSTVQIAMAARELAQEDGTTVAPSTRWANHSTRRSSCDWRAPRSGGDHRRRRRRGWLGAVSELLHAQTDALATTRLTCLGLPDRFVEHGPVATLRRPADSQPTV
jgi:hypothetical protein